MDGEFHGCFFSKTCSPILNGLVNMFYLFDIYIT